jgi:spore germination protein KA
MPGFADFIRKIFVYTEPINKERGFELLEDENEGNETAPGQPSSPVGVGKEGRKKKRRVGKACGVEPVSIRNWNEFRRRSRRHSSGSGDEKDPDREASSNVSQSESNDEGADQSQGGGKDRQKKQEQEQEQEQGQGQGQGQEQKQERDQQQRINRNQTRNGSQNRNQNMGEGESRKSRETSHIPSSTSSGNISKNLDDNLEIIRRTFDMPKNKDIVIREFKAGRKIRAFIAYMEDMVDTQTINLSVLKQLMEKGIFDDFEGGSVADFLVESILAANNIIKDNSWQNIISETLYGNSALFIDGCDECILINAKKYEKRNVESPKTEIVVTGPQEAFTENLRTNLTLIRRIIRNENLVTEILPVGDTNNSTCAVLYIRGIADERVVEEVKKRIKHIRADFVLGSNMIEHFIEDNPFMLFPQVINSERPDRTASFLMEGQVAVIADGTPFSISMPVTLFRLLHTSEDTFTRWPYGTMLRLIRLFGLFCATLLPGLYVAMIMYHPDVIPTELLITLSQAREPVPFPTLVEVLIMELSFELIREGEIRVPTVVGQTLGIVGALILGQAAVAAGLVSPFVVIIVAVTALGSFVIPNYSLGLAVRIERFFFIFMGAFLGFYGIALTFFVLAALACSMKSFGIPFLTPVAPRTKVNPDVVLRGHIWSIKDRPDAAQAPDRRRKGRSITNWSAQETGSGKGGEGRQ